MESNFVDIYSKDPLVLKSSKSFLEAKLEADKDLELVRIRHRDDLKKITHEDRKNDQGQAQDLVRRAAITEFAIFDKMSGEMIRLSRFPFILKWQKRIKGLVINPLTLLLVGPGRYLLT